jgi:cytochrome d ubiquinol oxidase subunit I
MGTEMGRQPWIIYGLLKTPDASSEVLNTGTAIAGLILVASLLTIMMVFFIIYSLRAVSVGPDSHD